MRETSTRPTNSAESLPGPQRLRLAPVAAGEPGQAVVTVRADSGWMPGYAAVAASWFFGTERQMSQGRHARRCHAINREDVAGSVSSYLVVQLYCTPAQAESVRAAAVGELAKFSEFAESRTELAPKIEGEHRLHLAWAEEHPGRDPGERTYFSLETISPHDVPESVLRKAEDEILEWIDGTFNDRSDDIAEVQWASFAEIRQDA